MQVHRHDPATADVVPEPTFTGDVTISGYTAREAPSRVAGATVTFGAGARTPWKTNPAGQTVVVTDGRGRAHAAGSPPVEIVAGDVVWFAQGEEHWEGAAPDRAMTYVVVQEGTVELGRAVTDEEYARRA